MFSNILADFRSEYSEKINSQNESENTKFFWEIMKEKNNFKLVKESWSDTEYPETEGLDGYDVMNAIKNDWWDTISIIWDWPYSIYFSKGNQLMHYIEWDLVYYEFS